MTQLLKSYSLFEKDVDYVVVDDKVKIVYHPDFITENLRYDAIKNSKSSNESPDSFVLRRLCTCCSTTIEWHIQKE